MLKLNSSVPSPSLTRRYSYRPTTGYPENLTMSFTMPAKARISTSIGGAATAMSECEGNVGVGKNMLAGMPLSQAEPHCLVERLLPVIACCCVAHPCPCVADRCTCPYCTAPLPNPLHQTAASTPVRCSSTPVCTPRPPTSVSTGRRPRFNGWVCVRLCRSNRR